MFEVYAVVPDPAPDGWTLLLPVIGFSRGAERFRYRLGPLGERPTPLTKHQLQTAVTSALAGQNVIRAEVMRRTN